MGDTVPLGRFGARSRGEPNSHGNGPHMRHLLRHDHYAIREFRSLDIACWLSHASIVAYVRLRTRLDGGRVSIHRVTLNYVGERKPAHRSESHSGSYRFGRIGLFRSAGSQSSGGNPIPQKRGEGCAKRSPTSVFPFTKFPRVTTVQAISSFVFKFVRRSGCSLTTGVASSMRQPLALTSTDWVISLKGGPDSLFP